MGINVLNNTSSQELRPVAGSTIASGDVVYNTDAGAVYPANTQLSVAQMNTTTQGANAISAFAQNAGSYYGSTTQNWTPSSVQLSNGAIVHAYAGNGTSDPNQNLTVAFRSEQNGTLYSSIAVTTDNVYGLRVRRIGSVGFVVSWCTSASVLKFAIYDNTGTVIKSATTVATLTSYQSPYWNVQVLASTDIVFVYQKVTSTDCEFQRYNAAGTLQGSATTVEAASQPISIGLLAQSSGGFVITYHRSVATTATKFARYDATGTLQGSLTTVLTTSSYFLYGSSDNLITELTGGNFVILSVATSTYPRYSVYDASGTLVRTATVLDTAQGENSSNIYVRLIPGVCQSGTGFALVGMGTSYMGLMTYSSVGAQLQSYTLLSAYTANSLQLGEAGNQNGILMHNLGGAGFVVHFGTYQGNPYYRHAIFAVNPSGTLVGSTVVFSASSATYALFNYCSCLLSTSNVFIAVSSQISTYSEWWGIYSMQRKSILGVAQEAIATGSSGRVATLGTYAINQSLNGAFDQRTATVPGGRGSLVGNSAVLLGLS